MKDNQGIWKGIGFGFYNKSKNVICMIRCFKCGRENYHGSVSSGVCAWCQYNPNLSVENDKLLGRNKK